MSRQRGAETVERLKAWIAKRDSVKDYEEYRSGHQVLRSALIAEGVVKRSQLSVNGNPVARELLAEAEARWFGKHEESAASHSAARERSEAKSKKSSGEVARLQRCLAVAKAELNELRKENEKLCAKLGILKSREDSILTAFGGLKTWD